MWEVGVDSNFNPCKLNILMKMKYVEILYA
jgi:hypothetical protein